MGSFSFHCPYCDCEVFANDSEIGSGADCPACDKWIIIEKDIPPEEDRQIEPDVQNPDDFSDKKLIQSLLINQERIIDELKKSANFTKLLAALLVLFAVIIIVFNYWSLTVKDHKIIHYSWDDDNLEQMHEKIDKVLKDGYEPAGYLCPNGIRGGFSLFVKRY